AQPTYATPQPESSPPPPQPTQSTVAQAPVDNGSYGDDDDDDSSVQPPPLTDTTPPPDYDDPAYDDDNAQVAGDAVPSVDVFYDQLDPYGTWYDDPTYGWAFTPQQADYVPYSNGSWRYTDTGLLGV